MPGYAGYSPDVALNDLHSNNPHNADLFTVPSAFNHHPSGDGNVHVPVTMPTAAALSNIVSPPVLMKEAQTFPKGHKYRCETCHKTFDRHSRLENCRNRHSNDKPYRCLSSCGTSGW
jgi:hypothetical protein